MIAPSIIYSHPVPGSCYSGSDTEDENNGSAVSSLLLADIRHFRCSVFDLEIFFSVLMEKGRERVRESEHPGYSLVRRNNWILVPYLTQHKLSESLLPWHSHVSVKREGFLKVSDR